MGGGGKLPPVGLAATGAGSAIWTTKDAGDPRMSPRTQWIAIGVILLAPTAGAPVGDVRFQAQPLRGGERLGLSMSSEMAVRIAVTVNGESQESVDLIGSIALSCVASVAEADEDGCTSATLAFGKAAEVEGDRLGERPTARVPDYANRNYDVARARSGFEITGARGDLSEREKQVTK